MSSSPTPDRIPWHELREEFKAEHRQGEHLSVVGPSGSGKTVLLIELAKARSERRARDGHPTRMTYLAAKPRDDSLDALPWPRIKSWPPGYGKWHVIVWPAYGDPESATERQRRVFRPLLRVIFTEGGQIVVIDEVARFTEPAPDGLGLRAVVNQYETEGRSNNLSLFGATQRPRLVPLTFWTEPKWLCIFRIEDHYDLARVRDIGGRRSGLEEAVQELDDHEFLLVRRKGGSRRELYTSRVEL